MQWEKSPFVSNLSYVAQQREEHVENIFEGILSLPHTHPSNQPSASYLAETGLQTGKELEVLERASWFDILLLLW